MAAGEHRLILTERKELSISGVISVDSFDNERIELNTGLGGLLVTGEGLKIGTLNLTDGLVEISGSVDALAYGKSREEKSARVKGKNIVSRLLK